MMKSLGTWFLFSTFCIMVAVFAVRVETNVPRGSKNEVSVGLNSKQKASVFLEPSSTGDVLRDKFRVGTTTGNRIKILLVPGHEPDTGGAEYRGVIERDMAVTLAKELARFFDDNKEYEVIVARDGKSWNPELKRYFKEENAAIRAFVKSQKAEMARLVKEGKMSRQSDVVYHNDAPSDQALHLYGVNKWANEHGIDLVIHIHFNDYYSEYGPAEYTGLSVYIPERQYSNASSTVEVAPYLMGRLTRFFALSDLPKEDKGVVEDQDLIAVGGSNSLDGASMLVEYGYVYEPQFAVPSVRAMVLRELAFQTYLGVQDFFGAYTGHVGFQDSTLLPYTGGIMLKPAAALRTNVVRMQAALSEGGFYPPQGKTKNDCPLSGVWGKCTRMALTAMQRAYHVDHEDGVVGEMTAQLLASSTVSVSLREW